MSSKSAAEVWESKYAAGGRVWSGKVNTVIADIASTLTPGSALDLGCGEGGDAIWLASRGWTVTAVDISPTAISRAQMQAQEAGIPASRVNFVAADLETWDSAEPFDLVTASFLHSFSVEIRREAILRGAAAMVAPGGYFLLVSHAKSADWPPDERELPTPQADLEMLGLGPQWEVLECGIRTREVVGSDGERIQMNDGVILARRS